MNLQKICSIYLQREVLKVALFGLMCGMSLLLSGNTLNFWLASFGINPKIIGFFSLIIAPYIFKFLISVFITNNKIYFISEKIGHYKSWLLFSILSLSGILAITSILNPQSHLVLIAFLGFLIAFFSVIQDIVLNHNRISSLSQTQQAAGSAIYSVGYRIGMLLSGAGTIYLSDYLSWHDIFLLLAVLYLFLALIICIIFTEVKQIKNTKDSIFNLVISPLKALAQKGNLSWVIIFIIVYRLSDNMLVIMLNPFLLQMQYTATEIASISKFFGIMMALIGGIISGPIITKIGLKTSLISFSLFHILGNFLLIILSMNSKSIPLLYVITGCEALTGGMMMAAYLTFISNLCTGKHIATQYAILSSGMGLSRAIFPSFSGIIVDSYGWTLFFIFISAITISTTIFTIKLPRSLFNSK